MEQFISIVSRDYFFMQDNGLSDSLFQMHSVGFVDPDDMNVVSGSRKYSSVVGYSSSKLAQVSIQ